MQQALAKPIVSTVETIIVEKYKKNNANILTSIKINSPQTISMRAMSDARTERLAKKYSVEMPVRAKENLQAVESPGAVNYLMMPSVFHGLGDATDEDLAGIVKPHGWPLQKEEWQLNYWLDQGFEVFVLTDHEHTLAGSEVKLIRNLHIEIKQRCDLVEHIDPVKPLYVEFSATIYRCADEYKLSRLD
jgi:hypothetical protein